MYYIYIYTKNTWQNILYIYEEYMIKYIIHIRRIYSKMYYILYIYEEYMVKCIIYIGRIHVKMYDIYTKNTR